MYLQRQCKVEQGLGLGFELVALHLQLVALQREPHWIVVVHDGWRLFWPGLVGL